MQAGIATPKRQKFGMAALFDDPSLFKKQDAVGAHQRVEAMGDKDCHARGSLCADSGKDAFFGPGVNGGGGVVKDEDRGGQDQAARNRHPLTLAARERGAAFADHGAIAFGEAVDIAVQLGIVGGAFDPGSAAQGSP